MPIATPDEPQQLLALVEAEVGSLLEFLPVALVVTSAAGSILRVNSAAAALLGCPAELIGHSMNAVLLGRDLSVRVRILRHQTHVIRLYVVQQIMRNHTRNAER
jgi:PAS domain S-box-containing protein